MDKVYCSECLHFNQSLVSYSSYFWRETCNYKDNIKTQVVPATYKNREYTTRTETKKEPYELNHDNHCKWFEGV